VKGSGSRRSDDWTGRSSRRSRDAGRSGAGTGGWLAGTPVGRLLTPVVERLRPLLPAVGVGALVLAVLVALVPAVGDLAAGAVGAVGSRVLVLAAATLAGLVAAREVAWGSDERDDLWRPGVAPERADVATRRTVGEAVDDPLESLANDDLRERDRIGRRWRVRSRISAAAVEVLIAEGYEPDAARDLLAAGTWTDDPRAAAFLGDVDLPLEVRVRDWLAGDGFRRSARAAVAAVERRAAATHRHGRVDADGNVDADAVAVGTASREADAFGPLAADLGLDGDGPGEPGRPADGDGRTGADGSDDGTRPGVDAADLDGPRVDRAGEADAASSDGQSTDGSSDDRAREPVEEVER
jgi:hypothetical protein